MFCVGFHYWYWQSFKVKNFYTKTPKWTSLVNHTNKAFVSELSGHDAGEVDGPVQQQQVVDAGRGGAFGPCALLLLVQAAEQVPDLVDLVSI